MAGLEEAALAYAESLGWPVFPCRGKLPAIAKEKGGRGYLDATTDAATISAWWRRYPNANIGVATGCRSGFWVLDVDGDEGRASLGALEREHGPLPKRLRQLTGGGGEHVLFAWDSATPVRNRTDVRGNRSGLDVRGHGGYIVVFPSVHPESGQAYRWTPACGPLWEGPATAPEWLLDLVAPSAIADTPRPAPRAEPIEGHWGPTPAYSRAALEHAVEAIRRAPIGQQEATLNGEAYSIGQLVASGHMPRELAMRLLEWAGVGMTNATGRRPWLQSEIREKIYRCFADAERHPRQPIGGAA